MSDYCNVILYYNYQLYAQNKQQMNELKYKKSLKQFILTSGPSNRIANVEKMFTNGALPTTTNNS